MVILIVQVELADLQGHPSSSSGEYYQNESIIDFKISRLGMTQFTGFFQFAQLQYYIDSLPTYY